MRRPGRVVKTEKGKIGIIYNDDLAKMYPNLSPGDAVPPEANLPVHLMADNLQDYTTAKGYEKPIRVLKKIELLTLLGYVD